MFFFMIATDTDGKIHEKGHTWRAFGVLHTENEGHGTQFYVCFMVTCFLSYGFPYPLLFSLSSSQ